MPNLKTPALIAVSDGATYPMASVADPGDANKIIYTTTISGIVLNLKYTISTGVYGSVTTSGTFPDDVDVYEVSSYGWGTAPTPQENQVRDYAWIKGDDGSVYKVSIQFVEDIDRTFAAEVAADPSAVRRPNQELTSVFTGYVNYSYGPLFSSGMWRLEVSGGTNDLQLTEEQKQELSIFNESSAAVLELSGTASDSTGRILSVRETNGIPEIYQKAGVLPVTEPIYLHASAQTILKANRIQAFERWDQPIEGESVAQRASSGTLSFTNGGMGGDSNSQVPVEQLEAGKSYRLIIDSGNIGEADPAFKGFDTTISIGPVTLPAKLCSTSKFANQPKMRFLLFGDYGAVTAGGTGTAAIAVKDLVTRLKPHDIFAVGNGDFDTHGTTYAGIDDNTGQLYAPWILNYGGTYPPAVAATVNRFWPAIGNHDWGNTTSYTLLQLQTYPHELDWWYAWFEANLPGNARYYDVLRGDTHFFILSGYSNEPDGNTVTSKQAMWLKAKLGSSTARWKVVINHFPMYTSQGAYYSGPTPVFPGETAAGRWPFKEWGAHLVVSAHSTNYERIEVNGLPYVVVGTGGATLTALPEDPIRHDPENGIDNLARIDDEYGVLSITATPSRLLCEFISTDDEVLDTFEINAIREKTEIEFEIPSTATVTQTWTLGIDWSNDADFTDQGFNRTLGIYGYELKKLGNALYKVAIDTSPSSEAPLVTSVANAAGTITNAPGVVLPPGTWIARYNSNGEVVDFTSELAVVPKNDTFTSRVPLAEMLTGSTEGKKDGVFVTSSAAASGQDPLLESDPAPSTTSTVTISVSAGPYTVGNIVTFTALPNNAGYYYRWFWWDGTTYTARGTNVVEKLLTRGGSIPQLYTVLVYRASDGFPIGTANGSLVVNGPPEVLELTVSENDKPVGYQTLLSAKVMDHEGSNVTWQWLNAPGGIVLASGTKNAGDLTPFTYTYTVNVSTTLYLKVSDSAGAFSQIPVELRGVSTSPPAVSISTAGSARIGTGQSLALVGRAFDPNQRSSTTYTALWTFWDGTTSTAVMTPVSGVPGTYTTTVNKSIASASPGVVAVSLKVSDSNPAFFSVAEERITLIRNQNPVIDRIESDAPTGVVAGNPVNFTAFASDPDGDALHYRWVFNNGTISTTPTARVLTTEEFSTAFSGSGSSISTIIPQVPIKPGSVRIVYPNGETTDNGVGGINAHNAGAASGGITGGTINYSTGQLTINSNASDQSGIKTFSVYYHQQSSQINGTLTVTDGFGGTAIMPVPPVLVTDGVAIISDLSATGVIYNPFVYQIVASGGGPFVYTATNIPPGLTFDATRGIISGTPSTLGTTGVIITAADQDSPTLRDSKTLTVTIAATAAGRPYAPSNLKVFEDGVNPTYNDATTEFPVRWNVTVDPVGGSDNPPGTVVEFRTMSDELKDSVTVAAGVDNLTYSAATLLEKFGSFQTFKIRAYHVRNNLLSVSYDSLTVTKV